MLFAPLSLSFAPLLLIVTTLIIDVHYFDYCRDFRCRDHYFISPLSFSKAFDAAFIFSTLLPLFSHFLFSDAAADY